MGGRCSDGRCRHPDASGLEPAHSLDRRDRCWMFVLVAEPVSRFQSAPWHSALSGDCVGLGDSERGLGREGTALALETRDARWECHDFIR